MVWQTDTGQPNLADRCRPIVEHLAQSQPADGEVEWQRWRIRPIPSGNNRLFRVTRDADDWAVKFTIRDERDRARREFNALALLDRCQVDVAPRPIHLDPDRYEHPVVVQTWLPGTPVASPPPDDATWLQILQSYQRLHQVRPADGAEWGPNGGPVVMPLTQADLVESIRQTQGRLPPNGHSRPLEELLARIATLSFPTNPESLCWGHGDPNVRNLILTTGGVKLVDWEYSGVTDPAHEIAKLMSHPIAVAAGEARWEWVAVQYAKLSGSPDMQRRIQVLYALRLAWWCARLLFGHFVLLQQPSRRLVGHGPEAEISTLENVERYFERARGCLPYLG